MTSATCPPIACTLAPGAFTDRLSSIAALNQNALRHHERRDLTLDLRYAAHARDRVREMVRKEQVCCAFLAFDVHETADEIRVTVTAPEDARDAAEALFEQFAAQASGAPPACGCAVAVTAGDVGDGGEEPAGTKRAGFAAAAIATGAVACAACCVLPFALPAVVLASTGGVLAWFADQYAWVTVLAVLAVVGGWGWVAWQARRARRRLAASTLYVMITATALTALAVVWPLIEQPLVSVLADAS